MSILFVPAGLLGELLYTKNWWNPITLTKTIIGIEDAIFAFAVAGIAAIIYERIKEKTINDNKKFPTKK
jgi:hypothetical protein